MLEEFTGSYKLCTIADTKYWNKDCIITFIGMKVVSGKKTSLISVDKALKQLKKIDQKVFKKNKILNES